jgi:hypothetical protein
MNLTAVHYVLLALSAIVSICGYVAGSFPQYAALAHAISGLAASLGATLGVLSPSGLASVIPAQVAPPAAPKVAGPVGAAVAQANAAGVAALEASK